MVLYNTNSPTYDLAIPFYNTRSVEEWLRFWKNLQAIITAQNITNVQGMYMITKSMLWGDTLNVFEKAEGVNRPQSEPNYKQTRKDVHRHMFPLHIYLIQTWYMYQTLVKPHDMPLHVSVACVNKMDDRLEQFPLGMTKLLKSS
eukprot:15345622-Ditylum_brightwellii.AAC.1